MTRRGLIRKQWAQLYALSYLYLDQRKYKSVLWECWYSNIDLIFFCLGLIQKYIFPPKSCEQTRKDGTDQLQMLEVAAKGDMRRSHQGHLLTLVPAQAHSLIGGRATNWAWQALWVAIFSSFLNTVFCCNHYHHHHHHHNFMQFMFYMHVNMSKY